MCRLMKKYWNSEFIGYKVVCKKNDGYYSVAMGFRYPIRKDIPVVKKQQRMSMAFVPNILTAAFEEKMSGRTAAFVNRKYAQRLFDDIRLGFLDFNKNLRIVKVKLTKSLMEGKYNAAEVVAGRHMEVLKDMDTK